MTIERYLRDKYGDAAFKVLRAKLDKIAAKTK